MRSHTIDLLNLTNKIGKIVKVLHFGEAKVRGQKARVLGEFIRVQQTSECGPISRRLPFIDHLLSDQVGRCLRLRHEIG